MSRRLKPSRTCWDDLNEIRAAMTEARSSRDRLPELRRLLNRCPGVVREFGDVAERALQEWIWLASQRHSDTEACVEAQIDAMRIRLAAHAARLDPLEELLIHRILASWVRLHYLEQLEVRAVAKDEPVSIQFRRAKVLELVQRGHLAAIAALNNFRRLLNKPGNAGRYPMSDATPSSLAASAARRRHRPRTRFQMAD